VKSPSICLFFGLFCCVLVYGQNSITGYPGFQLKPVFNQGFVIVHRSSIGHLVRGYPSIYELNISKPTLGNHLWHVENNMPDLGITLQWMDFKNSSQLGHALTAAPYVEIPLNAEEKMSRLIIRLSWGVSYVTKRFDINENHKNIAIGSHFNCFTQFRWFWHIKLNEKLRLEPGMSFSHVSNGRLRNPNLGLNVVSANLGLNYLFPKNTVQRTLTRDSSTKVKSKNELLFIFAKGLNQRSINSAPLMRTFLISGAFQRNVRNTHKFSAGMDVFYDQNYTVDYGLNFNREAQGIDLFRISVRAGYSYNVGRVSFPLEVGYYIHQKVNPDAMIVSRIGVRYYSPIGLVGHFGLRTHYAVAYNFEFGLGYRLFL
jgi:hypothetical protein